VTAGGHRASRRSPRATLAAAALIALTAPAEAALEDQVTAAYLYNFARFVDWSAAPDEAAEFLICVEGSDTVRAALAPVEGQPVAGRPVAIRAVQAAEPDCRILFVSRVALGNTRLPPAAGVLTVSDAPDFVERGGIIGLVLRDGRLRFRVNRDAARAAGLRVPPQILALAVD
jgi:hypothetical protein